MPFQVVLGYGRKKNTNLSRLQNLHKTKAETILRPPLSVIRGDFNQFSERYSSTSRGVQCTPNALVSICISASIPLDEWNSSVINYILDAGDKCYLNNYQNAAHPLLTVDDINVEVSIGNAIYSIRHNFMDNINSMITKKDYNRHFDIFNCNILENYFNKFSNGLFTTCLQTFAIFKQNNYFYLFDSHSRGLKGESVALESGRAVLLCFECLNDLFNLINYNFCDNEDNPCVIIPIEIAKTENDISIATITGITINENSINENIAITINKTVEVINTREEKLIISEDKEGRDLCRAYSRSSKRLKNKDIKQKREIQLKQHQSNKKKNLDEETKYKSRIRKKKKNTFRKNLLLKETTNEKQRRLNKLKLNQKNRLVDEKQIDRLKRLEKLKLNQINRLVREKEIDRLKRLEKLKLNQINRLVREKEIDRLKRLEKLKLNQINRLVREKEIDRLKRLEKLKLNQINKLVREKEIDRLKRLEKLKLNQINRLVREKEIDRLKRLEKLKYNRNNRLVGEKQIDRLKRLEKQKHNRNNKLKNEKQIDREKRLARLKSNQTKRLLTENEIVRQRRLATLICNKRRKLLNENKVEQQQRLKKLIWYREKRLNKNNMQQKNILLENISKNYIKLTKEIDLDKQKQLKENILKYKRKLYIENKRQKDRRIKINLLRKKIEEARNIIDNTEDRNNYHTNETRTFISVGMAYQIFKSTNISQHTCGLMDQLCQFCKSFNFKDERPTDKFFSVCCSKGKVSLATCNEFPTLLQTLMSGTHPQSKTFMNNIRKYNSAFAFASLEANIDYPPGRGPYCFRICGQIYHRTSAARPADGKRPQNSQLYILDPEEALINRMAVDANKECNEQLFKEIDTLLRNINPYANAFQMMREVEEAEQRKATLENRDTLEVEMRIVQNFSNDPRRYNLPTTNEVALIYTSLDGLPPCNRDICVYPKGSNLYTINILNENCDPMIYPLLCPTGEKGCSENLLNVTNLKRVTHRQFYSFRLRCTNLFNPYLSAGKLTQQYIVDAYSKIESNRLNFIRNSNSQKKLRLELYSGLMDYVQNKASNEGMTVGRMVILPSSYVGSPRSLTQNYFDSMSIVQKFGSPDLFITMTCNPEWPEIKNNLNENQRVEHRPDLVARVFNLKIKELLNDLLKVNIFGKVAAMMSVVEFQKRGLPHIHILIILTSEYKIRNSEAIDKLVCAEIPNIETEPELYNIIKKCNVHGPCGTVNPKSPCMTNFQCTKGFPKEFEPQTLNNVNGYPLYRRRDNNSKIAFFEKGGKFKYAVDNRWIVPYNKYLSYKYNCHINVEICASVKSVKYLFKYIYKGHDCANVKVSTEGQTQLNWDEVSFYLDARYVSPPEAIWRIFAYDMQFKTHSIYRLAVHMENHQSILFTPGEEELAILNHIDTTLTAWFKLNLTSVESRKYFYTEIPEHFVFNRKKIWTQRKRFGSKIIARLYSVSPKEGERFYLRLVLLHIRGATSYTDLRTVNGTIYSTFAETAKALGLLKDDSQWNRCLEEASLCKMPKQLRHLFAFICIFCEPTDVKKLWNTHIDCLCEDYNLKYDKENATQLAVNDIIDILVTHNCNYFNFGLPEKRTVDVEVIIDSNNQQAEYEQGLKYSSQLNLEQRNIFDNIMSSINNDNEKQKCYFIDGPGGSGKTFLYTTVLHVVRGLGLTALSVAWTGISALLLKHGRTVHSLFKLPVPLNADSTSSIRHNSVDGKLLKEAKLIIWDEVTMAPYFALDIIDMCLRDLMNNSDPFGNKIILLGGDFRQCLPVVKRGSVQDILASCIQNSRLWSVFSVQHLTINMRVSEGENEFMTWLLKIGDGLVSDLPDSITRMVKIPSNFIAKKSLVNEIYEDINLIDITDLKSRVILCPLNEHTLEINEAVLNILNGETTTYLSNDSVSADSEAEQNNFPIEFLNSLTPSGMPPHKLNLKIGAIIMLLRNMSPKNGLCNGTRLIVKELHSSVIVAEIISGNHSGNRVFIPKIILAPSDVSLPFTLKRIQFPIRLAFAMTINKAQGQTFEKVGVLLREPVFAHGQLYVALSRVKSSTNLKIEISDPKGRKSNNSTFTSNVVYEKVLLL